MSLLLAPYTNAMRLGQGFNSYTQQICVDDAVCVNPNRHENVLTNDGSTMRIVAEASGKPSVWNRIKEVVDEEAVFPNRVKALADVLSVHAAPIVPSEPPRAEYTEPPRTSANSSSLDPVIEGSQHEEPSEDFDMDTDVGRSLEPASADDLPSTEPDIAEEVPANRAIDASITEPGPEDAKLSSNEPGSGVEEAETAPTVEIPLQSSSSVTRQDLSLGSSPHKSEYAEQRAPTIHTEVDDQDVGQDTVKGRTRSLSVGRNSKQPNGIARGFKPAKLQVKEIPTRAKTSVPPHPTVVSTDSTQPMAPAKALSDEEIEQARLDKIEKIEVMKQEKARLAEQLEYDRKAMREQRDYQRKIEQEAREEERVRRLEDQKEQQEIRREQREYDKARRAAAQQAITDAVAANKNALTMDEMKKIKAQNQLADHFDGMVKTQDRYSYDPSGARGPSQVVTYSSRFIDKLSDVTEDMCVSAALSVKAGKFGASGKGSFVDSDKFKQSDLNFYISVKVVNQTVNFKDALEFNSLRSVGIGSDDFNKVYGDSFISGFVEGGEFNAIVSMKIHNKAKLLDIQAEAKVALTAGPVDLTGMANVAIARTNLEMNTETTIQVSWSGGGHVKPREQPWNIETIMQAAARFPELVASCPQRTYAILTKYESLRSFIALRPAAYSPIQYESAQIYTNVLMDAFMSYKALYKKLGDQVASIQNRTMEFDQAGVSESQASASNQALMSEEQQSIPPGTTADTQAAKKYAAALAAAVDVTPFQASLGGISDARKQIRRQMMYIVNEIDLIEKDPKIATDDDHGEPFQAPLLFETRLPLLKIPDALKPKTDPLTGKRIMAKTQTEEELENEQREQEELKNNSPPLYGTTAELNEEEKKSLDEICVKVPGIGKHMQVSSANPIADKGFLFNNLEFLLPDWQVESITIGITPQGSVGSVQVIYESGLVLRKGLKSANMVYKTLDRFRSLERITSASIEIGSAVSASEKRDETGPRVLSVCMFTNRGRRLLGQAISNEILPGNRVRKNGTDYENVQTIYSDSSFSTGTFKGFFGRVDLDETNGGILRLGFVWGDNASSLASKVDKEVVPYYDVDSASSDAAMSILRKERDDARANAEAARLNAEAIRTNAQSEVTELKRAARVDLEAAVERARGEGQQIKMGSGVNTTRHSVSFRGDNFRVSPSSNPFLTFANGRKFVYQNDGNLVVYESNGSVAWTMNRNTSDRVGQLIWHAGNDGNLVAWKENANGSVWATETKTCRNGSLVFSNEAPYMEIFDEHGQRRAHFQ